MECLLVPRCLLIHWFLTINDFMYNKMRLIIIAYFLLLLQLSFSQEYSVSGYVEDSITGERIIGAYVIDSISKEITFTNDYGYFALNIGGEDMALRASYIGSSSDIISLTSRRDTMLILKLSVSKNIEEVVVLSNQYKNSVGSPLGQSIIPVKSLLAMPALGEPDLLKSIQNQPGIKGGVEGSSGIFVRGSGGGENLFMLDDVPIYNVNHLYGFFSTFNSSAIKHIKLLKGGFPARYGGRTASIIDVRSLDGNNASYSGEVSISLLSSRATIEGPVIKDKTTFLLSARRSYIDVFANPFKNINVISDGFPSYFFYDVNFKMAHTFNRKNRLYLSWFKSKDNMLTEEEYVESVTDVENFYENRTSNSGWDNMVSSLRWNHVFNSRFFSNTTIAHSRYNYFTVDQYESTEVNHQKNEAVSANYLSDYSSDIEDFIFKMDFDYYWNSNVVKFGIGNIFHSLNPGTNAYHIRDEKINEASDTLFVNEQVDVHEPYSYVEFEWRTSQSLNLNAGLRQSGIVSQNHRSINFEPRFRINYNLLPNIAIKGGYSRMYQYLHLLTSYGLSMPSDLWVPAVKDLRPLSSDQVNAGVAYSFGEDFLLTAEVYYKWLYHTTDYRNGESMINNPAPWHTKVTQGSGIAKGLELLLEKQSGRLHGHINYTLSASNREYDALNNGHKFSFMYDRLHDLAVSVNYKISDKLNFSALWVYGTGYPVSLPVEKYLPAIGVYNMSSEYGGEIAFYPSRNNSRLPQYHRLDLGLRYVKKKAKVEHHIGFDVFNAYNRKNPVFMYFGGYRVKSLHYQSLLPIIPSVSYTYKFN